MSGAAGAIINGSTRDIEGTALLQFPVFAKTYNSADVRRRAIVDYIDKSIIIDGHKVSPNDLIFIDSCSMIVIYAKYEVELLTRLLDTIKNEKAITIDILMSKSIETTLEKRGAF